MRNKKAATPGLLLLLTGCCLVTQGTSQEVNFTSDPPGASFKVRGVGIETREGTTPDFLDLPKQDYQVDFTLKGYKDQTRELKCRTSTFFYGSLAMGLLSGGIDWLTGAYKEFDTDKVHVNLELKPGASAELTVDIKSTPSNARIQIDGAHYGVTPMKVKLVWDFQRNQKELILRLNGYREYKLMIRRNEPPVNANLEVDPVSVPVTFKSNPPGAKVEVDGRAQGFATPWDQAYEWTPGMKPRKARFTLDGFKEVMREFTRDTKNVAVDMEEILRPVPVQVETYPAGAAIEVDGVAVGESPAKVTLVWSVSRKTNTLNVSRPGYQSEEVTLEEAQTKIPLKVRLRPMLPKLP